MHCPHLKVLYVQCTFKRHYGQIAPHFILLRIAMLFLFKTHMCDCLNPYHSVARNTYITCFFVLFVSLFLHYHCVWVKPTMDEQAAASFNRDEKRDRASNCASPTHFLLAAWFACDPVTACLALSSRYSAPACCLYHLSSLLWHTHKGRKAMTISSSWRRSGGLSWG